MARKSIGHTKLIWICPNCQTRNPGPKKSCITCGSPQPDNIAFVQADSEQLISDENELRKAKKGADIHCPYCGTRNSMDAEICVQCGGKIAGGKRRASGSVVGAHRGVQKTGAACKACGHWNKPNAPRCSNCGAALGTKNNKQQEKPHKGTNATLWMVIGFVVIIIIGFLIVKGCSRSNSIGIVESVSWVRTVAVEQFVPVIKEDWWEEIPADAYVTVCDERYHFTSSEPEDGAVEVCGTPYTLDQGTGYGEVVQDCVYEVYDSYCEYEISAWEVVEVLENEGTFNAANWPDVALFSDQRAGEQTERYSIWFKTENGRAKFETNDYSLFSSAREGSEWELTFDGFGNIRTAWPQ